VLSCGRIENGSLSYYICAVSIFGPGVYVCVCVCAVRKNKRWTTFKCLFGCVLVSFEIMCFDDIVDAASFVMYVSIFGPGVQVCVCVCMVQRNGKWVLIIYVSFDK